MANTRKQTRASGEVTRAKILDAAEDLFGNSGFDAVSLREITVRADVTLALASYHFGTKDKLFEEVVARRAPILCEDRIKRLNKLDQPTVEQIADAFMAPLFERAPKPEWRNYCKVLGRLGESNQWLGILAEQYDETAETFIAAFCDALPGRSHGSITRSFMMMLNLMLSTVSQHGRIDQLSDGVLRSNDMKAAYKPLLAFSVAGFIAATE